MDQHTVHGMLCVCSCVCLCIFDDVIRLITVVECGFHSVHSRMYTLINN